jgi:hypothetical protein
MLCRIGRPAAQLERFGMSSSSKSFWQFQLLLLVYCIAKCKYYRPREDHKEMSSILADH